VHQQEVLARQRFLAISRKHADSPYTYFVVTGDAVVGALTNLVQQALSVKY
jgi:hypothetical protein